MTCQGKRKNIRDHGRLDLNRVKATRLFAL